MSRASSAAVDYVEEAERRTVSSKGIAVELGLPYPETKAPSRLMGNLIEVCFGAIFGVSLALLTDIVSLSMLRVGDYSQLGKFSLAIFLGIFVFHVLGRIVGDLAGLASEQTHHSFIVRSDDHTDFVGDWMKRAAIWTTIILILTSTVLVAVEANVEKHGIMRSLLPRYERDQQGPSSWMVWMVVVTVSLPFVLHRIVEAWKSVRAATFRNHVDAVRSLRVAETAQSLRDAEERMRAVSDASGKSIEQAARPVAGPPAAEPPIAVPIPSVAVESIETRVAAQLSLRAFLETWQRTREACARKREVLSHIDREIERLSAMRLDELPVPSQEGLQRIDAAYNAVVKAVQEFDELVQRDVRYLEKKLSPRLVERIRSLHGSKSKIEAQA